MDAYRKQMIKEHFSYLWKLQIKSSRAYANKALKRVIYLENKWEELTQEDRKRIAECVAQDLWEAQGELITIQERFKAKAKEAGIKL